MSRIAVIMPLNYCRMGTCSFVSLHPEHPIRKKYPEFLYAVRSSNWEGDYDFQAELVDGMVPLISGRIYQAYTDKDTAMKAMTRMSEDEFNELFNTGDAFTYNFTEIVEE